MRLETPAKILKEQLKGAGAWFMEGVLPTINTMIQDLYNIFNGNIDDSNIACQNKQMTFTTLSTYPTDFTPIKFRSDLKFKPTGLQIQQCVDASNYGVATYNPGWNYNNGSIIINELIGLAPSTTYTITFRAT